jgi:hypothetical protein
MKVTWNAEESICHNETVIRKQSIIISRVRRACESSETAATADLWARD